MGDKWLSQIAALMRWGKDATSFIFIKKIKFDHFFSSDTRTF